MGFSFRKSIGSGPFRMNFSKSGISYSVGVKGARLNFSNRGTYVNFGSNGIYYRKKILSNPKGYQPETENYTPCISEQQHTITSANVEQITDTDSEQFIKELTDKGSKASFVNWFGIIPLIIAVPLLLYIFFSQVSYSPEVVWLTKEYVKPLSSSNINIRISPSKTALIIGTMKVGDKAELLNDENNGWYKMSLNGDEGFVSKSITEKLQEQVRHEKQRDPAPSLFQEHPNAFWTASISMLVFFIILFRFLLWVDRKRLLIEIYYDIDVQVQEVYDKFIANFAAIHKCTRVWQYLHSQPTNDYKYSSGAGSTITRKLLTNISIDKKPSRFFQTNVQIPFLGLINTQLYFFPERLIVKRGNHFGAIMYKNIDVSTMITQFIETEGVPSDAVIVGKTWRYLNKNGGPDRRFNNNYQIPICHYSEYRFKSSSGLNEMIATSKVGGIDEFIRYIKAIGQLQRHLPEPPEEHPLSNSYFLN
jgi:hypothetical protein